ncbi:MAG: S8 family serine peptidase, partial [Saprospiraceae bacterium]
SYSANPFDCSYIGDYTGSSAGLDAMMLGNPSLLHVFAAGNSGSITCAPYAFRYATVAGGYQSAKNVLTVGAINISDAVVGFSSRGPVDDGRLKPEIVAYGQNRFSTINGNNYTANSGTSFSSPAAMGIATLLYERYKQLHNDSLPDAALIKNIICNGADDLGRPGPDYEYGFGRMNGVRSVEIMENHHYDTVLLDHNDIVFKSFSVSAGTASVDIMLLWTDVSSAPYETEALVNDLDLLVIDPSGDTIRPWKLNYTPGGTTLNATTGADHHNNYEQATVTTAEIGMYTLMIKGHHVPMGPQLAWISWDVQHSGITIQSPIGGEVFKPGNVNLSNDRQYIRWDAFGTGSATFLVEYSKHPDSAWVVVANNIPADRRFQDWFVPAIRTDKLRIRVTATNGMQDTSDADAVIMPPPSNFTCTSPCNGYLQLSWTAVQGATSYQVYRLKNEILIPLDTTSGNLIIIEGLPADSAIWISVAGVFPSGKKGLRPKALLRTANGGNNCTWPHDLRLDSLLYPHDGRQFTSSALSSTEKLTIFISNAGQQSASGFSLSYRVNNGSIVTETYTDTILPGTGQSFEFVGITDFSGDGDYLVEVWTTYASDNLHENDTIIQSITHHPNQAITLPWDEDFDSIPYATTSLSTIGLPGLDAWDVTLGQQGRIRNFSGSPFCHSGQRSLTMDVIRSVSNSHGELLLTLNMVNYSVVSHDIRMSFHHMHHELLSDVVNTEAVWIRGSDTDPFVLLTSLPDNASERGQWKYFSG